MLLQTRMFSFHRVMSDGELSHLRMSLSGGLRGLPEREVSRGRASCSATRGGCAWWPGSAESGLLLWSAIRLSADRDRFAVFGTGGLERGRFAGRVLAFGFCGVRVDGPA